MTELFMLILMSLAWGATGFSICTLRHRQKGMETDRFWDMPADLLPDGGPVVVPDDPRELVDA